MGRSARSCGVTFFVLLCISTTFRCVTAQTDLRCIPLKDCPVLYDLYRDPTQRQMAKEVLRMSHCGYENNQGFVWCAQSETLPNCRIPHGFEGSCVPLQNCGVVSRILVNITLINIITAQTLREMQCNLYSNEYSICCPSKPDQFYEHFFPPAPPTFVNDEKCGVQLSDKIVFGQTTELDEFPWTARLLYEGTNTNDVICGGTLINSNTVITAAHCVDRAAIRTHGKLDRVVLGDFNINDDPDCINGSCSDNAVFATVAEVIVHPGWESKPQGTINHDIAIVRLARPVRYSQYIVPICLPSPDLVLSDNQVVFVTGWGNTELGVVSPVKLKAKVNYANKNSCIAKYRVQKRFLTVGDGLECAGGKLGPDSCAGDSGGPLMYSDNTGEQHVWFLVGVVSFGSTECGRTDLPALYTYLPKYIDWIGKNLQS